MTGRPQRARRNTGTEEHRADNATWSGTPLTFPRIQGAGVCGRIAAVGEGVASGRIGERVLVRTMLGTPVGHRPFECWTLGSECDGGFAQYVVAPARETYAVRRDWSDEELAAVQLARRRGASVVAVTSAAKAVGVRAQGADRTLDRARVDVVLDLVGGPRVPRLLDVLRPGGRYAVAGAIGGPTAEIDLRDVYLRDLTLVGCTFQEDAVFENLVGYVERGEIRPVVSRTYPLRDMARAQEEFLTKRHLGKLVLVPPSPAGA
ncbi:hypothetical protein DF268_05890 [Streptomyces sp. V2]|uniref:zinc-binding dehydrogenase n=1 Tax=Streptomyces TaxID=1883 RepID=UPI0006EBA3E8|nr:MULTISPECIES: zinc-binding dehydrogenase [Streptomyces]PWG14416.1 hypothetical protein DF268_05890 [Streptomyces sp. V2]